MSSAYGFTEDSARRIARVVKAVEGDTTEPTRIGPMLGGSTMSVVKVTALGSPLNTGQRVDYHASANTMNDINEVKIKEVSGAALTVGQRYMGQFSGYDSTGKPVFVVKAPPVVPGGGSAVIDVVTDVQCGPEGLTLSTVTFSGADYSNAVIRNFLALSDVTQKSYTANQGRCVVVNAAQTGLEFGVNTGTLTADLTAIKADIVTLKSDVVTIKANVLTLQGQMTTLQGKVTTLESGYADLLARIIVLEAP